MNNVFFNKKHLWLTLFAVSFGFVECAVVVYLRYLYYPDGFEFPIPVMDEKIFTVEFFREIATIIMLLSAGYLAGRNFIQRFAYFLYSFAVWDIFYYVFLKLTLNWPESFFTWDVLFLIPITWIGPVLAPVICSLSMIVFAGIIILYSEQNNTLFIHKREWVLLSVGSLIILFSFIEDYLLLLWEYEVFNFSDTSVLPDEIINFVPQHFSWWIFGAGEMILITAIMFFYSRNNKQIKNY